MIEVKDLEKVYKSDSVETPVLHGVSFNIEPGEFVAIMGPSGSGKSTLMHIMGFLDRPTGGIYKFEGKSIDEFNDDDLARIRNKKMGFVFQTYNLLPRTTVFDNVRLPLVYSGLEDKMEKDLVKEAIAAVGLSHRINFYSNQLSGGEQQRVAIARALVNNPSVIFADEPTGNLDSRSGKVVMLLLQELNDEGHTIVLVTHEKYTSEHAKRIIQLYDGRLVSDEKVSLRRYAKDEKELIK
ncbi:MAG: macrolide ABC transporter ATP-binding protein [Candidatus Nealsonbacteria bacterium CG_4_10_14_0_2_um_filter_38_17]|uniref:Macrolide ABC transporter ATP-binding protein n=1 Tax=Candidatus Nealsonbacteria bacterium CG_4_10_14_0_2_um_filter_38_17 TaxID=1974680 RepID=A0A2M7UX58_9BACT|nr:MAG: macrolide ABC transporter ATP-binding protein [Candidatus Nealsonbacteria bacterium CG_4_10_14_0_2_um_filter_38_17]